MKIYKENYPSTILDTEINLTFFFLDFIMIALDAASLNSFPTNYWQSLLSQNFSGQTTRGEQNGYK